jgi:pyruvate dehydrogenase E1 component alpha subunit
MLMHTTADDPKKYRSEDEVEEWKKRDPITRFKNYLTKTKKIWDEKKDEKLEQEIKAEIDEAVKTFENFTDYEMDEPFDHVFGSNVSTITEQRAEFLADYERDQKDA